MKKLLKFMLMPMLVGTPAMSVVACANSNTQYPADQILNIAVGRMNPATFKMKGNAQDPNDVDRLGLTSLPETSKTYEDLSAENKNVITQHFKTLVTTGSETTAGVWQYPSVDVIVSAITGQKFTWYGTTGDIQAKISVNVNLTYQGLQKQKKVTLVVFNDVTDSLTKAKAIANTVKASLNTATQTAVDLDTLPMDGIKGNSSTQQSVLTKISSSLAQAWVNPTPFNSTDKSWMIDVIGNVQITATPADNTNSFYTLDSPAISSDNKFITATLTNLNITITYKSPFGGTEEPSSFSTADLTTASQKIKVQQSTGTAMKNQLANALPKDSITLSKTETAGKIPLPDDTWETYVQGNGITDKVLQYIFTGKYDGSGTSGILSVYNHDKMIASGITWDKSILTITGSTKFQPSGTSTGIGKFVVNFILKYNIGENVEIDVNSAEITINNN